MASLMKLERHEKAVDGERHVRKNCTIRWQATHWENCPSQCHGNQVRSGVAVRKSDAAEAAGSSEMPVPTVIGTGFAGVKRSQDEAEVCDELSSVNTTRSLDTVCADTVRKLLELAEGASNSQVYRPIIVGIVCNKFIRISWYDSSLSNTLLAGSCIAFCLDSTAVWRGGLMHARQLTYQLHASIHSGVQVQLKT